MNYEEKVKTIADILEVELEEVKEESVLEDFETWDSVAVLSFIAVMNEKFNKFPHASEIRELKTIKDLIDSMK